MAKRRPAKSARERGPAPPRMVGMGLVPKAVVGAVAAALVAAVAVYAAGSSAGDGVEKQANDLAVAICAALTAPEATTWAENNGTWKLATKIVADGYSKAKLESPKISAAARKKTSGSDHRRTERNKERLADALDSVSQLGEGVLRGLQINFSKTDSRYVLKNLKAGAYIPPNQSIKGRLIGNVTWARMKLDNPAGGTFLARVFHREYRGAGGRLGDAYVILSENAIQAAKGGPGMWLFLAPLLVGAAAGISIAGASKASKDIQTLARDLDQIGRGKLEHRVTTGGGGEVGYAQQVAARMAQNLASGAVQMVGSDVDSADTAREVSVAAQIHESLRPQDPPSISGYEIETLFKPGSDIGGDYFDYIELDESRIALVIADTSESLHGVAAAMVMAMMRAYLKSAMDPEQPPSAWLRAVNRRLARDLKTGMAVTAMILVLDAADSQIVAASAGHKPLVMWRKGKTATINPNGIALGLDIGPVFDKTMEDKKITMQKGDRLVLYTDGVVSARNEDGEAYGDDRFQESIRKQGGMNSAAFVNFAAGGVDTFLAGAPQSDDVTITTVKRLK